MIEFLKTIMAKPLQGVVAVLCMLVIANNVGLTQVRVVQAKLSSQSSVNDRLNERTFVANKELSSQVFEMNETLIRIDENLIAVKRKIERDK